MRPPPKQIRFDSMRDEITFSRQKAPATSNMAQATSTSVAPCVRDTTLEGSLAVQIAKKRSSIVASESTARRTRTHAEAGATSRPSGDSEQDRMKNASESLDVRIDLRDVVVGVAGLEVEHAPVLHTDDQEVEVGSEDGNGPRSHLIAVAGERRYVVPFLKDSMP